MGKDSEVEFGWKGVERHDERMSECFGCFAYLDTNSSRGSRRGARKDSRWKKEVLVRKISGVDITAGSTSSSFTS